MHISVSQKPLFNAITVFVALKPLSFCRNLVFKKCTFLCPFFGETLVGQKWCTLFSAQLQQNKTAQKKPLKPLFLLQQSDFCCYATKTRLLHKTENNKKNKIDTWVFFGCKKRFVFEKLIGDV